MELDFDSMPFEIEHMGTTSMNFRDFDPYDMGQCNANIKSIVGCKGTIDSPKGTKLAQTRCIFQERVREVRRMFVAFTDTGMIVVIPGIIA